MKRRYALLLVLLMAFIVKATGQGYFYICTKDGNYGVEQRNMGAGKFYLENKNGLPYWGDWLQLGPNAVFDYHLLDSMTTERPTQPEPVAVGWQGDMKEGTVYFFPLPVEGNRFTLYYKFECRDSLCVSALLYYDFFSQVDADAYFLRTLEENRSKDCFVILDITTGSTDNPYVRRTLTRPRRPRQMYSYTDCQADYQRDISQLGYDLTPIYRGMPMELIQRVFFLRSVGDGPYVDDMLPDNFLFGHYADGHYESASYNTDTQCSIDLVLNEDGTQVMGYDITYTYTDINRLNDDYNAMMEDYLYENDRFYHIRKEGMTIRFECTSQQYVEDAVKNLIYFDTIW